MGVRSMAASGLAALLVSCGSAGPGALSVDLTTDLVPGYELGETQVEIPRLGRLVRERISIEASQARIRIARFDELENGTYEIVVRLYSVDGALIDSLPVQGIRVRGESATPVVYTRGCREVDCPPMDDPQATSCINRQCVEPECRPETPLFCELGALCEAAAECAPPAAECARVECVDGACLDVPIEGACPPQFVCTAEGCVPGIGFDAGPPCVPGGACDTGNDCEVGEFACVDGEQICVGTPAAAMTVCRASTGPCDPEELCDGVSLTCPDDAMLEEEAICAPDRSPPTNLNECECRDGAPAVVGYTYRSQCDAEEACIEAVYRTVIIRACNQDPPPIC